MIFCVLQCDCKVRNLLFDLQEKNENVRQRADYSIFLLSLQLKIKTFLIMNTVQLRAELFREMKPLLDSDSALEKVLAFVKGLVKAQQESSPRVGWADAAKQAHAEGADQLMIADVFADEMMEDW